MALAGIAFSKATLRKQIMVATTSVGPGCSNLLTAAAVASVNRIPLLMLSGDYFAHRAVDPVLQQVETFTDPTVSVCDAFKPVVQVLGSDQPSGADHPVVAAGARHDDGSSRLRTCVLRPPPGCPGGGVRLSRRRSSTERYHYIRRPVPDRRDIDRRCRHPRQGTADRSSSPAAASATRRPTSRSPASWSVERFRSPRLPLARPPCAATILTTSARSASSVRVRPTPSPRMPTSSSRSEPDFRTSPPVRGRCSRTPTPSSS